MEIFKAYKYRIYPNKNQKLLLEKHFGACRWVYNWCLSRKIEEYTNEGKTLSKYDLMREVTQLKKVEETSWLKEVNAQSVQSAVGDLDSAYTQFFRTKKDFPKFKSKKTSRFSAEFRQGNKVSFDSKRIFVMKFREGIKFKPSREFHGAVKSVTISRTPTNKYYASVLVLESKDVCQAPLEYDKAIGVDLGIKTFAVCSDGKQVENPRFLNKSLKKLAKEQRRLSRKKKGSKNRNKQRVKVAKAFEKVSNKRDNFLHKETRKLVDDNQVTTFCLETLNVAGMLKNRKLSRHIGDASWSKFVELLTYKAEWEGKNILRIGQFEPSSKTCNVCGLINKDLKLSDRQWVCKCGAKHDRDFLAACNIKHFAFSEQNLL